MRGATAEDYAWLYAHGYMESSRPWDNLPIYWLLDRKPRRILDIGSGNGAFGKWITNNPAQPALIFP